MGRTTSGTFTPFRQSTLNPGEAAGIAGRDDVRARREDVRDFLGLQSTGHVRLKVVVNARRTAALVGVCHLNIADTGNALQQSARGFGDLLTVRQMAGIVVGDRDRRRICRRIGHRAQADLEQILRNVADFRRERVGARRPRGVVGEKMPVVFDERAAARRIEQVSVRLNVLERRDQFARVSLRRLQLPPGARAARRSTAGLGGQTTSMPFAARTRTVA